MRRRFAHAPRPRTRDGLCAAGGGPDEMNFAVGGRRRRWDASPTGTTGATLAAVAPSLASRLETSMRARQTASLVLAVLTGTVTAPRASHAAWPHAPNA